MTEFSPLHPVLNEWLLKQLHQYLKSEICWTANEHKLVKQVSLKEFQSVRV